jgi:hypothetical protein
MPPGPLVHVAEVLEEVFFFGTVLATSPERAMAAGIYTAFMDTQPPPPPPKIEARLSLQWGRVWRMLWALGCPPHGFIYFSIPLPHPYLPIIQQNHFLPIFVGCNFFGVKFCTGIFLLFEISVILLRTIKVFFIVRFQVQKKNMSTECIVLDW